MMISSWYVFFCDSPLNMVCHDKALDEPFSRASSVAFTPFSTGRNSMLRRGQTIANALKIRNALVEQTIARGKIVHPG